MGSGWQKNTTTMSKHSYDTSLQWFQRHEEFDRDHKAIMLVCSHENYDWVSYGFLSKRSGLDADALRKVLHELTLCNVLLMQQSQGRSYFALRERIERNEKQ